MVLALLDKLIDEIETVMKTIKSPLKDASKNELLVYKYLDEPKNIPFDIIKLINNFYPSIKLYGIGKVGELPKFTLLSQMSSLCDFDQYIT